MKNAMLRSSALLVSSLGLVLTGCRNNQVGQMAPIVDGNAAANDPAAANLLPTQVAGVSYAAMPQSSATNYAPQAAAPAPGNSQQNEAYRYNTQPPAYAGQQQSADQQGYVDPQADANEYDQYSQLLDPGDQGSTQPPPPLPADYEQPEAPAPDNLWTPGYWDYANTGYYYVPGSWVSAPYAGALWTPGWWGYVSNRYRWHHGYWGRHVGYYGGINYGFGYIGYGYQGGYWNGDHFFYNRAVNRVNPRYVNNYVYSRNVTVVNREYINNSRTAYYGPGGLNRRPAPQEFAALREQRTGPMQAQIENRRAAEANRQQFFNANNGRPQMLYAAHALNADRNIVAPPRTMPANFNNNGRPGFENRGNAVLPANASPQQRQQFEQQRQQFQQQANVQQMQQRQQLQQQQNQQRQQQANVQQQQRQQFEQQRQLQQQQQQRQQSTNVQQQQRMQQDQQRQQLQQQQQNQQRQQQANVQQQQRQQQEQQRQLQQQQHQQVNQQQQQAAQQRQQADAQRQQQQQANVQREQQAQQQRQQQQVQMQQRQQADQQRQQQQVQQQQRQQQEQQRQVQVQQQQVQQQQRQQQQAQQQQRQQQQVQQQQQAAQRQQQAQQMQQQRQAQQQQHQQMQARPAPAAPPHMEMPHPGGGPHH